MSAATADGVVKKVRLIYSDVIGNNNKFWYGEARADGTYFAQWGRVGAEAGQTQEKSFGSAYAAEDYLDRKMGEKLRKGYTEARVLDGAATVTVAPTASLKALATKQISTDSPVTLELVRRLVDFNVHNILRATTLQYDTSRGTFSTPLGPVTDDAIDEARRLLDRMTPFVSGRQFQDRTYIEYINQYLRLIPQKVGRKLDPETLYPDTDAIKGQHDILDSLEASLKMIVSAPPDQVNAPEPKLFEASVKAVDDGKTVDKLKKLFETTKKGMHQSSAYRFKTAYHIDIAGMTRAFEARGAKMTNIWELWHGTPAANLLSIMKSGFLMPKSTPGRVTGAMFGDGIYASDQSTKALNYATGYWGNGGGGQTCFMFLLDMAMGKYYTPRSYSEKLPKPGYDSTFAEGQKSGVANNEMIVYSLDQIRPKFLVEFTR